MSRSKNNRVFKCAIELDLLSKAKTKKQREYLLRNSKDCVIDSISEIALNCLKGHYPIESCDFDKLKRYRKVLRELVEKTPAKRRRALLIQKGGFLNILLGTALSYLGGEAVDYLRRKISGQ